MNIELFGWMIAVPFSIIMANSFRKYFLLSLTWIEGLLWVISIFAVAIGVALAWP